MYITLPKNCVYYQVIRILEIALLCISIILAIYLIFSHVLFGRSVPVVGPGGGITTIWRFQDPLPILITLPMLYYSVYKYSADGLVAKKSWSKIIIYAATNVIVVFYVVGMYDMYSPWTIGTRGFLTFVDKYAGTQIVPGYIQQVESVDQIQDPSRMSELYLRWGMVKYLILDKSIQLIVSIYAIHMALIISVILYPKSIYEKYNPYCINCGYQLLVSQLRCPECGRGRGKGVRNRFPTSVTSRPPRRPTQARP